MVCFCRGLTNSPVVTLDVNILLLVGCDRSVRTLMAVHAETRSGMVYRIRAEASGGYNPGYIPAPETSVRSGYPLEQYPDCGNNNGDNISGGTYPEKKG